MQSHIHPQKYMQSRLRFFSFSLLSFEAMPLHLSSNHSNAENLHNKVTKTKIITSKRHTLTQYNMKVQLFSCRSATISDGLSISSDSGTPAILDHRCLVVGDRVFHSTSVTSKLHLLYCLTQVLYWSSFVSQYRGRCHQNLLQRTVF